MKLKQSGSVGLSPCTCVARAHTYGSRLRHLHTNSGRLSTKLARICMSAVTESDNFKRACVFVFFFFLIQERFVQTVRSEGTCLCTSDAAVLGGTSRGYRATPLVRGICHQRFRMSTVAREIFVFCTSYFDCLSSAG